MTDYILKYYQNIRNGTITAGKFILMIYERIIKGLEDKTYVYDAKQADNAIKWIEKHCRHTEGPLAPGKVKLELWQKAILSCIYGIRDPKTNYRQFREIVLIVSRKNGKSAFASWIAEYELFVYAGYGARIFCIAPKLDQAELIYNDIWTGITLDEELLYDSKKQKPNTCKHRMTDLFVPSTNSIVKKIAFSAKKSDGFNPSLTVCDEVASWQGDAGLKQYEVMKSGMGARPEGIMLSCSTSGYISDSIYDELIKRSTRFLLGESKETRLLPFIYMIDDINKWNDINELKKSNPNLSISVSVDYLLEEIAVAEGSLSKRNEFLCKYCCVKQNSSLAWIEASVIEKAFGEPLNIEDFKGNYCVCGIDLSQTTDLTCCIVVIEKNGINYVFAKFFMPEQRIDDAIARDGVPYRIYQQQGFLQPSGENFVDYHDCYEWLVELVEKYEILPLMVGYDRYSAQYLIQDLNTYGFLTDDVYQGENLTPVINEFEGKLKDGVIKIGDNSLLKMHLLDSALRINSETNRKRLVKLNQYAHIDGTAALLDAFCVKQKWHDTYGEQLKNEG